MHEQESNMYLVSKGAADSEHCYHNRLLVEMLRSVMVASDVSNIALPTVNELLLVNGEVLRRNAS